MSSYRIRPEPARAPSRRLARLAGLELLLLGHEPQLGAWTATGTGNGYGIELDMLVEALGLDE